MVHFRLGRTRLPDTCGSALTYVASARKHLENNHFESSRTFPRLYTHATYFEDVEFASWK